MTPELDPLHGMVLDEAFVAAAAVREQRWAIRLRRARRARIGRSLGWPCWAVLAGPTALASIAAGGLLGRALHGAFPF